MRHLRLSILSALAILFFAIPAMSDDNGSTVTASDTGIKLTRPAGCHDSSCVEVDCPHELNAGQRKAHAALTKDNQRRIDALSCWERLDFLAQYSRLPYQSADYNQWIDDTLSDPTPVSLSDYKSNMWLVYPALAR
jgi:hypothetical protein